jgi:hypothetical protein
MMALRYQHATFERDAAITERLGVLLQAADAATDEGPGGRRHRAVAIRWRTP